MPSSSQRFAFSVTVGLSRLSRLTPRLQAAGVVGVTLRGEDFEGMSETGFREVRARLARVGLSPAVVRATPSESNFRGLTTRADIQRLHDDFTRAVQACRGLDAPGVVIDLLRVPGLPDDPAPPAPATPARAGLLLLPTAADVAAYTDARAHAAGDESSRDADTGPAVEWLRAAGDAADRAGIRLIVGASLVRPQLLANLVASAGVPARLEVSPASAPGRPDWDVLDGPVPLGHVVGADAAGEGTSPAEFGRGDVDWPRWFSLLGEAGFDGFVTVRSRDAAAAIASAASA